MLPFPLLHRLRPLFFGLLVLGGLLGSASSLQATHIVGGEMTYRCLGDDQYEIRLVVFRDCFNGVPYFDTSVAYVGIYNNGDLIDSLYMPFQMVDDTLHPVLSDTCLVVPPNVCVHTTYYIDTVKLPPIPGGYNIVYQRCCRNYTISNIISPDETGATFNVLITEEAMAVCNSSPRFTNWPPIYICAGKPLTFDHSAVDEDGDSLVYRLCTPFDGATPLASRPTPGNQTVPMPVIWQAPYDLSNLMGGEPLVIDSATGLMTAVPNTVGQFVVGVCMEEYRDGELLSVVRRDFQYNVGICGEPTAAFFVPDRFCDLEVQFDNQSTNFDNCLWYFDGLGNAAATSTEFDPFYVYPDSGIYEVALIVQPGSICADTFISEINVVNGPVPNFFVFPFSVCFDTVTLNTVNTSYDTVHDIVSYEWKLYRVSQPLELLTTQTGNEFSYQFIDFNSQVILSLLVENDKGCVDSTLRVARVNGLQDLPKNDTLGGCLDEPIFINPGGNPAYQYQWSPADFLSDSTLADPLFSPPDGLSQITFSAQILRIDTLSFGGTIISIDSCNVSRQVTIKLGEKYPVSLSDTVVSCVDTGFILTASSPVAELYEWSDSTSFDTILAEGPVFGPSLGLGEDQRFFLRVDHGNGCRSVEETTVANAGLKISLPDTSGCLGDTLLLKPQEDPPGYSLMYQWSTTQPVLENQDTALLLLPTTGKDSVLLQAENQWGCIDSARGILNFGQPYPVSLPDSLVSCVDTIFSLTAFSPVAEGYEWSDHPFFDTILAQGPSFHPSLEPGMHRRYYLRVDHGGGCRSKEVVLVANGSLTVALPDSSGCIGDTLVLSPLVEPGGYDLVFGWSTSQLILDNQDTALVLLPAGMDSVHLQVENQWGCVDSAYSALEYGQAYPVSLPDSIISCADTALSLSASSPVATLYEWSDTSSFDPILAEGAAFQPLLNPGESQIYHLRVDHGNGCRSLEEVWAVRAGFQVSLPDTSGCTGDTIRLEPLEDPGVFSLFYQWDNSFPVLDNQDSALVLLPDTSGAVRLLASNQWGCVDSARSEIQFGEAYPISLPDSFITCADTALMLTAFSPVASLYEWSDTSIFDTVLAQGPVFSPPIRPGEHQRYVVRVDHGNGCRSRGEVLVVNAALELSLPDSAGCAGDTLLLVSRIEPPAYQLGYVWTSGHPILENRDTALLLLPDSSGTVRLLVANEWGCRDSVRSEIEYGPAYPLSLNADSVICDRNPVWLTAGSPVAAHYVWSTSPSLNPPLDTTSSLQVSVPYEESRTYYVRVDHGNGCASFDSVRLDNQGFVLQADSAVITCAEDTVLLSASTQPVQSLIDWSWTQGMQILSAPDSSFILTAPLADALYLVEGVNSAGCSATDTAFVEVLDENLDLQVSADPDTIVFGESSQLLAQTSAPDPTFLWSPSLSLNFDDIADPEASPGQTTTYTMEVTSENGCLITRTVTVVVTDPPCLDPYVFFPNVFSPNGDGENDFLQVYGNFLDEVYFAVYNRWGEKVFEGFSKEDRWDGTFRGKPLSSDVYGYYLRVRCFNGEWYQQKGNVTLLR